MTSLLLIISFLLHVILLAAIYYLYQQIQELKTERSRETEMVLSRFLDEIKQENRQLQLQLKQQQFEPQSKKPKEYASASARESTLTQEAENMAPIFKQRPKAEEEFPPITVDKTDKVEASAESRIFQLHKEGVPAEVIAKRVNRGKTEVELLLKLHQPK